MVEIVEGDDVDVYRLLPQDLEIIDERLQTLVLRSYELSDEIIDARSQSSETWHDNAPLDIVINDKEFVESEISKFSRIKNHSVVIHPPLTADRIEPGTIAIASGDIGKIRIELAGDWQGRYLIEHNSDHTITTLRSHLGKILLGKTVGEIIELPDGGSVTIDDVRPISVTPGQEAPSVNPEAVVGNTENDLWKSKRILFVCGPPGSGKEDIFKNKDFKDFDVINVDSIRALFYETLETDEPFQDWLETSRNSRVKDKDLVDFLSQRIQEIVSDRDNLHPGGIVIVGCQSSEEINSIEETVEHTDSRLMYVRSSKDEMFEKYTRGGKVNMTRADFDKVVSGAMYGGLYRLAAISDYSVVNMRRFTHDVDRKILADLADWAPEKP